MPSVVEVHLHLTQESGKTERGSPVGAATCWQSVPGDK